MPRHAPENPLDIPCFVLWSLSLGGSLRDGHGTCGWGWKTCPRLSREASLLESWSINVNQCQSLHSFHFVILFPYFEDVAWGVLLPSSQGFARSATINGLSRRTGFWQHVDFWRGRLSSCTWVAYQQSTYVTWNHGNHRNRSWIGPWWALLLCTKQELGETYHESSFYQALRSCGTLGTVMVSLGLGMLRGSRDNFCLSGQDNKDMGWTAMNPTPITIITSFSWGRLQPSRLGQSLEDWLHGVSFSIQAPQIQERNVFSKITALGSPER